MKLQTKSAPLLKALELASQVLSSKRTLPTLTCAEVGVGITGVGSVTCDSLDARMTVFFEAAPPDEPFTFLAPARLLKASLRADEATIVLDGTTLNISSGGKTKLLTMDASEFPKPWADISTKPVDAAKLFSALKMASACTGAGFETVFWDKASTNLFGTDRKSLCAAPVELGFSENFVLPVGQARIITGCFEAGDDSFAAGMDKHVIHVQQGDRMAWLRCQEALVPDHQKMIPQAEPSATVSREGLKQAMDALSAFTDDNLGKIAITPDKNGWMASAKEVGNESEVQIQDVQMHLGQQAEPFLISRSGMSQVLAHWTAEKVVFRRGENSVMLTPEDESGAFGILGLYRA